MNTTSGPTTAYSSLMIRLTLQPFWVRFVAWAVYAALVWWLVSSTLSLTSTIGVFSFGVVLGVIATHRERAVHAALNEAVLGLGKAMRSQAIASATRGLVPGNPQVRYAAIRLGVGFLRGKSVEELKRQDRQAWIATIAVSVATGAMIALAVSNFKSVTDLKLPVLMVLVLILSLIQRLSTRRIARNVAVLTSGR